MPQTDVGSSEDLLAELAEWVALETPTTDPGFGQPADGHRGGGNWRAPAPRSRAYRAATDSATTSSRARRARASLSAWPGISTPSGRSARSTAMPYRVDGAKAHGPGIYDMKAGSFLAFHAVRSILRQKVPTRRPIVLLLTPDEEVGSPTSREWIEREASQAACVLIPEPAGQGGACVTARKGVGRFVLRVAGRGAHSGGSFQDGASAVVELARQIVRTAFDGGPRPRASR